MYSEADRAAKHVSLADEAFCIGPAPARDSYLRTDRILEVGFVMACLSSSGVLYLRGALEVLTWIIFTLPHGGRGLELGL